MIRSRLMPAASAIGATLEEPHDIGTHTVGVDGLRVGHSWPNAHMGDHDRCVVPSGDRKKFRIGETADVVADIGADLADSSNTDARKVSTEIGRSKRCRRASTAATHRSPLAR